MEALRTELFPQETGGFCGHRSRERRALARPAKGFNSDSKGPPAQMEEAYAEGGKRHTFGGGGGGLSVHSVAT